MKEPDPEKPPQPHALWPGLAVLGSLLLLVLWDLLSGRTNPWGTLVFLGVGVVVAGAAVLAARLAARVGAPERVVVVARILCALFVPAVGLGGYAAAASCGGMQWSAEAFWCLLAIFVAVGSTLAPFTAAYAVYRHARRAGKTHVEAQALSRWDPGKFGLK